ncbi:uncharacterized protein LOC120012919 [Tripterygium wilfordii]|uniref:uncharacterized protein LOC120012919 n=1 Tax=Tripterygium wilfordii TaxID=458696 RepID=UPI0018F83691|nr:uncharacterized protein LOC120012919 [Tripterygium wilfordii]
MASSLRQWESDPLFSAAEVVQDSADRAESIFRLLLHEQSLVQYEPPDPKLLTSMEYHRLELKTILETAKWQLEDFERAVGVAAMMETSQTREHVITRHMQFIRAIKEQINHVEKSLGDPLMGDSVRNSEWVSLNEQDSDGLALFITGGNPTGFSNHNELEDSSILRRFLDPAGGNPTTSGLKDDENVEHGKHDIEKLNGNRDFHVDQYKDSIKQNNLRKVGSRYSSRMSLDALNSLYESNYNRRGEHACWDLEANEAKPNGLSQVSKLRGSSSRLNILGFLNRKWTAYGSRARNYTKRLKDGEEQRHVPSFSDISYAAPVQHIIYRWFPCHFEVNWHSMKTILLIVCTLIVLVKLVSRVF